MPESAWPATPCPQTYPYEAPAPTVPPWRSSQHRRGRPQTIRTAGHACPNPACPYYGITDAAVHALVGCGHHGAEHIQDFRCQACQTKVSARRNTALYRRREQQYISSGHVQKANEVLEARRQKWGGMHWSVETSDGLAALRTLVLNGGWERYWVEGEVLPLVEAQAA